MTPEQREAQRELLRKDIGDAIFAITLRHMVNCGELDTLTEISRLMLDWGIEAFLTAGCPADILIDRAKRHALQPDNSQPHAQA